MKTKTELKYGIILGLVMCFYTVLMWLTKLDSTYLSIGHYFDIAIIIIPLSITFLAIWAKSKETRLTLLKRISCGLAVNFIGYIIYTPFLLLYHRFINPDWLKYVLELKEKELLAQNVAPEKIKTTLETVQKMSSAPNLAFNGFIAGVIVFGIVFSLLTLPFFRRSYRETR